MQAIILAAGMGKRLKELTADNTKCMVKVNGETLIERVLGQLDRQNLERIVLVVGYKGQKLKEYVSSLSVCTPIVFVENPVFDKTNNIYSLFLAKDFLLEDDTLLLESDLIIEDGVLEKLVSDPYPSLALVARYESWMDGTVVTLDDEDNITGFLDKKHFCYADNRRYYKTVNIYKFGKAFSTTHYVPFLEAYSKALGNNEYYEQVLKVIALLDRPGIKALPLVGKRWYEIDDVQDLDIAETLFEKNPGKQYEAICSRDGGYWRYPNMLDFCYLGNPYFPPRKMLDEMGASFDALVREYPSGLHISNMLAANYYGLHEDSVVVGNGATQLVKALLERFPGIGMVSPSFQEYQGCFCSEQVCAFYPNNEDFSYTVDDLMAFFGDKDLSAILLANPDNLTGSFVSPADLARLLAWSRKKDVLLIVDESFSDFAEAKGGVSLLDQEILRTYENLVVIKSISKSYGVPGVRLGILATTNRQVLDCMQSALSVWNINSIGEFFLQILGKYKDAYDAALTAVTQSRKTLLENLDAVGFLRPIPSQSNFVMCEVTGGYSSRDVSVELLEKHRILVQDLSRKAGMEPRQFIRLTVRDDRDNRRLVEALHEIECRNAEEIPERLA
jgi:histidinol-phosphate/aromatic aminotransferase/cobyric acid decarboxylase-like protein/choline kinase